MKSKSRRSWCRRLCCAVLAAVLSLALAVPSLAADTRRVRVAVIDYPNFLQMQDDGTVSGYAYEYLQTIRSYTGWEYQFVEMSFTDASNALAAGEIDLLAGSQYTAQRAAEYDFSSRDMGEGGTVLCVLPDDTRYCYNDYTSYGGMKIAALTGSVRISQTEEKLAQYGVQANFSLYDTDEAAKAALERGEVDAVLMSTIRCESSYKILARINSAPMYFCTNRAKPELKTQLDAAMEQIHLDEPYYEEDLDEKYFGSVPIQLAFTQEELDYIAAAGPITVAVAGDLMPIEYYNESDRAYAGIVPDSLALIEDYSGLSFRLVPRTSTAELNRQMKDGTVQIIASVANDRTFAAVWDAALTDVYFYNSASLMINDNVGDYRSSDCSVVVCRGYPYLERLALSEGYRDLLYADSFADCVAMVDSRKADLTVVPSDCVGSLIHSDSFSHVSSYLIPNTYTGFCMGVANGENPLLLSILNKSLTSITQERRTELLIQNLTAVNDAQSVKTFFAAHRLTILAVALAVVAVILCGALLFAASRQKLNRKLRLALDKADAASRAKTDFLGRMSHDMRTPMNGILGLSYLMEDSAQTPELKQELIQLRESGQYLLQLINDVLDVNKVESGHIELHPRVCDEEVLFSSVIALVKPQMEEKQIDFHFEMRNIEWTYMLLDEQRVKQIFVNLLSNAVKFTPSGGRIDFIMELVSEDAHTIRDKFVIRDTGIGMSEAFLSRLFEPFAQENRTPGAKEGTGLGLFIVKSLVELMGGSISVESQVDRGTEFTVYLNFPLAEHAPDAPAAISSPAVHLPAGLHVLLCEDHPLNAKITRRLLEKEGALVAWAEDGRRGVELFSSSGAHEFDLILMDIRMPVMDGLEAARAIRSLDRPDAKTVPIIAMTANAYEEDIEKSLSCGMNAHLAKPVVPDVLYGAILQQLDAQHRQRDREDGMR